MTSKGKAKTSLESLSAANLKELAKDLGLVQSGDKGTVIHRIKMHQAFEDEQLYQQINDPVEIPKNPCNLPFSQLKVIGAKFGVSPMGTQDEMLTELLEKLRDRKPSSTALVLSTSQSSHVKKSSSSSSHGDASEPTTSMDGLSIAKKVLEYSELDDYESILSLASPVRITHQTSIAVMRKAYLKLSLLIHPDKLTIFSSATKAFQALVSAFEILSNPNYDTAATNDQSERSNRSRNKTETKTIARSNDNCFMTDIHCPRCRECWTKAFSIDGNPDYLYNFFMMGLKQYHCSTCLFQFGCMTAIHRCPHCRKTFEYSPSDYHRQIHCGNASSCMKTGKLFGFYMFPTSDLVMKEFKAQVKEEQEQRIKATEAKRRRAQRSMKSSMSSTTSSKPSSTRDGSRTTTQSSFTANLSDEETAYISGLNDICPRCGFEFEEGFHPSEEDLADHLKSCTDKQKHQLYQKQKQMIDEKRQKREMKQMKQDSVQTHAAWSFLGGKTSQLWLLDEEHLQIEASKRNIDITRSRSKYQMINEISKQCTSPGEDVPLVTHPSTRSIESNPRNRSETPSKALTASSKVIAVTNPSKQHEASKRLSFDSLPSNIYSLSSDQLLAVCASHGILDDFDESATKEELLNHIESKIYGHDDPEYKEKGIISSSSSMQPYQPKNEVKGKRSKRKADQTRKASKKRKRNDSDDSDEEDYEDEEYVDLTIDED